jgi:pimeloyl-ACP methyl ester carboxylesterase
MGTGIATILASNHPVAALALEAPYTSIADVAADRYWWLPVRVLIDTQIDAAAAIPDVHAPLLFQHGDQDRTIPIEFGRRLFALANEPKQFVQVPGADHFIFNQPTFEREIKFFEDLRRTQ